MAGFGSVLGIDNWNTACDTFATHHKSARVVNSGIDVISNSTMLELSGLKEGELGILCGGPPCQGFSVAGERLSNDPRNYLFKEFLRAAEVFAPAWIVMENVPNLLNNVSVADALTADLDRLGTNNGADYEFGFSVVNAANFGVPQTRSRLIIIAKRSDIKLEKDFDYTDFVDPIFSSQPIGEIQMASLFGLPQYTTFDEAVSDLPTIHSGEGDEKMAYFGNPHTPYQMMMRGEIPIFKFFESKGIAISETTGCFERSPMVYNHRAQDHSSLLVERFNNIREGGSKEDLRKNRPDLLPPEGHPEQGLTYGRLWRDRPASTIPANYSRPSGNRSIHPWIPRLITPREAMRLSSFPDYYELKGLKVAQREQVGNAVPPLLAFHIARRIADSWIDIETQTAR